MNGADPGCRPWLTPAASPLRHSGSSLDWMYVARRPSAVVGMAARIQGAYASHTGENLFPARSSPSAHGSKEVRFFGI
jgi:hypothetical protein